MTSFSEAFCRHDIPSRDDKNFILKVEKVLADHEDFVNSVLYFGPPHNKIVSCSDDSTIRIWSYETSECLKTIGKHTSFVYDLLKLTDVVFLSCSVDETIRSFNISSLEQEKEFRMDVRVYALELLRLTDNLFLCRNNKRELVIWSYEKEEILKKYYVGFLDNTVYRPLLLSQKYPHCFYVATMDNDETIKLVNYEKDEVVKEFKCHSTFYQIMCLCLFFNSKNEEILVCPTSSTIYTYNTSHPQFNTRIKISEIVKWDVENDFREYKEPDNNLFCCFCYNNQYLFCGEEESGTIHSYELQEAQGSIEKLKEQKVHKDGILDLLFLPERQIILTCSDDETIRVTRVGGLSLKTNFEVLDQKERIEFLMEYMKENSEFFLKVLILQLGDPVEIVVPKTLLLL